MTSTEPLVSSPTPGLAARVAVNAPLMALSRLASAAAGVITLGVSARYLSPDQFGALTTATIFVSLASVFCDAGLYVVAAREIARSPGQTREILQSALALGLLAAVITTLIAFPIALLAFGDSGDDDTLNAIVILSVMFFATAPTGAVGAWFIANERAWITQAVPALGAFVTLLAVLAVALLGLGLEAVAVAYALGAVVNVLVLGYLARGAGWARLHFDPALWRRILTLAVPLAGITILGVVYWRADGLLLAALTDKSEVALYGIAFKVFEVLFALAAQFMLVLFPAIARLDLGDPRVTDIMSKAVGALHVLVLPMVILGVTLSPAIVLALAGSEYRDAAIPLAILMVTIGLSYYKALLGNAMVALGRQRRLVSVAFAIAGFNILINLALIPALGVDGAAIAMLVTEAASLVVLIRLYLDDAPGLRIGRIRPALLAGSVMAALCGGGFLIGSALGNPTAGAVCGSGLGAVAYITMLRGLGAVPVELERAFTDLRRVRPG